MSRCQGCGGVVGRDCFNPVECLQIAQSMMWNDGQQYQQELAQLKNEVYVREQPKPNVLCCFPLCGGAKKF